MAIYHANKMLNYMKKTHIEEKEHSEQKSIHALSKKKNNGDRMDWHNQGLQQKKERKTSKKYSFVTGDQHMYNYSLKF